MITRATCLFLIGSATVAVGVHAATMAHGNVVLADTLAGEVHACDDVRVRIEVVGARVDARLAGLRVAFEEAERAATEAATKAATEADAVPHASDARAALGARVGEGVQ